MVDQAALCVSNALQHQQLRQQIDFLLPVNEKERRFTATEPDDYPCSLQKEFDTAVKLTTLLLQKIANKPNTEIASKRLDDGGVEGEPCAVLYPTDTKDIAAVVFPTAERLQQIKSLAAQDGSRPMLIVNPQWREEGQVISDFGIGPWRQAALDFLSQFPSVYYLKEKRIGNPGTIDPGTGTRFVAGGVVRILRQFPEKKDYEVYAMSSDGSSQLIGASETEPKYNELDMMIQDGRRRKMEIFVIAQKASSVFGSSSDSSSDSGGTIGQSTDGGGALTAAEIDALDKASVQRLLVQYKLPGSGRLEKLKERLKEALLG